MTRARRTKTLGLGVTAGLFASLAIQACGGAAGPGDDGECISDRTFFQDTVYAPILAADCINCHNTTGDAKDSEFILVDQSWGPDYLDRNLEVFTQMARLEFDGSPWVLMKPTGQLEHPGGARFEQESDEYKAIEEMIARLENPTSCEDENVAEQFFDGVQLLDEVSTLRKATLSLVGRLPTAEEEQAVREGGFEAMDAVLDGVMTQPEFFDRLIEIYNDHLLTDRYYDHGDIGVDTGGALDLWTSIYETPEGTNPSPDDDSPIFWFDSLPEDQRFEAERATNNAVARESLELIAHVVRNDLPFSEVLTATYTMIDENSSKLWGIQGDFSGPYDFVPVQIPGIPHAGVLTSTVWMVRFPTTDTNRNRHRARMVYLHWLGTDVQALGERPLNADDIGTHNPTMNDPACVACHATIDPVAATMQNWTAMGEYLPREEGWYTDMRPAGYGEDLMPAEQTPFATQWMAQQVVQDPRFAMSAIRVVFTGLSGQEPLKEPSNPNDEGYLEGIRAARVQAQIFGEIAEKFRESDLNLKVAIKEIVKSPYYRAYNAEEGLSEERLVELKDVGTGRLLTPEALSRKIIAVTGYPWSDDPGRADGLLDFNRYRLFYGGIDSDNVVTRVTEVNGIMANASKRMANQVSCLAVPQDFAIADPSQRKLFPLVEPDFEPEDVNGFEVPAAMAAIRANIQHLIARMHGVYVEMNDDEVTKAAELFVSLYRKNRELMANPPPDMGDPSGLGSCSATADFWTGQEYAEGEAITQDSHGTIKAWQGVMVYLLNDYLFLHE